MKVLSNHPAAAAMTDVYHSVYEALDASVANSICLASSEAKVQRALTQFRANRSDPEAVVRLENISVVLQQLALASMTRDPLNRLAVVERLRASAKDWMLRLPIANRA